MSGYTGKNGILSRIYAIIWYVPHSIEISHFESVGTLARKVRKRCFFIEHGKH